MFVTLQGGNYTANLYLFLAIYPLYDKENSEKFENQFQCFFKLSQTDGRTFKTQYPQASLLIHGLILIVKVISLPKSRPNIHFCVLYDTTSLHVVTKYIFQTDTSFLSFGARAEL